MTDGDVRDWIAVATKALEHVPLDLLEMGCRAAQLRCTHHSQIVPVIEAETRDELAWRNRPKPQPVLMLALPAVPAEPIERPPLPEPDTLNPALQRMGLSRGWIIEAGDGRLVWSDVTTAGGEACNFGGSIRRTDPEP
ncbi:hypothetical protein [Novosphingobium mathurense]|nr:hypothetical protein [Novosphingobium mathurense]